MNCRQANTYISIKDVFDSFSLSPSKGNSKTAYYFAIDREENTPSLLVNYKENFAFDFGTGKKYDNVSVVQCIKKCSVSEALQYLSHFKQNLKKTESIAYSKDSKQILFITKIKHPALIEYLKKRKVYCQRNHLVEIHYSIHQKKYFGIGFRNNSNGYEVRNKYVKICLGKKDITLQKNQFEKLRIFEGFMDFLSFKVIDNSPSDFIILNSVALVNRLQHLIDNYQTIETYFDNDNAGNLATNQMKKYRTNCKDCRDMYQTRKDLNDFLTHDFHDGYRDVPIDPQI